MNLQTYGMTIQEDTLSEAVNFVNSHVGENITIFWCTECGEVVAILESEFDEEYLQPYCISTVLTSDGRTHEQELLNLMYVTTREQLEDRLTFLRNEIADIQDELIAMYGADMGDIVYDELLNRQPS